MMKGVYFYEKTSLKSTANVGIQEKIKQQIECLKALGDIQVGRVVFKDSLSEKIKFLLPFVKSDREERARALFESVDADTDYIYIRKPSLSSSFYAVLRKIKIKYPRIRVIMEIPTYPFHSEYVGISKLAVLKSINCENKLKNVIDKIVTYSGDDDIWGISTIKMPNCVPYDKIHPRSSKYNLKNKTIRLTCVANFMYWHGIDRLIKGLKKYDGSYNIVLNIVGGGSEIDNLVKMSSGMKNVVFHGVKIGDELSAIFDETDIAVDALGRHRSGVYYNSSLKGKEYVARGIPVVSAVKTDLDELHGFKYYLRLPSDESSIVIGDIVNFYEKIYFHEQPNSVTKNIREKTERFFDYKYGFMRIIDSELTHMIKNGGDYGGR